MRCRWSEPELDEEPLHPTGAGDRRGVDVLGADLDRTLRSPGHECMTHPPAPVRRVDVQRLDGQARLVGEGVGADDAAEQQTDGLAVHRPDQDGPAGGCGQGADLVREIDRLARADLRAHRRLRSRAQAEVDQTAEVLGFRSSNIDVGTHTVLLLRRTWLLAWGDAQPGRMTKR